MALADLIGRIDQEAREKADKILQEAQAKVDSLRQKAAKETEAEAAALREQGTRQAKSERDRILSLASLEARKRVLSARQGVVSKVVEEGLKRLEVLSSQDYFSLIEKRILATSFQGPHELILSEADKKRLPDGWIDKINQSLQSRASVALSKESREIGGGCVLKGGKVELNFSFRALLHESLSEIETDIAKALFAE